MLIYAYIHTRHSSNPPSEILATGLQVPVVVRHRQQECELVVHVVDGEGPDLMGTDWLRDLN